jgi:hypothetical protein
VVSMAGKNCFGDVAAQYPVLWGRTALVELLASRYVQRRGHLPPACRNPCSSKSTNLRPLIMFFILEVDFTVSPNDFVNSNVELSIAIDIRQRLTVITSY